ncbi:MAG: peptidoglycan-associated lipoprotein Pal [Rhodospirillales bacterium]|nr:peptidoglycan-associated lipoprotein Pal [Rhodospirillales bacterium]
MRYKILSLFAAVALLSACETASSGGAGGAGSAKSQSFTSPIVKSGTQQDLVVNVGDRVFFDFDKYNLDGAARKSLEKQAAWMKANPSVTVQVAGHADERGTREYNLALGDRRANSVKDYLGSLGVNPSRVDTISYGKERPVATGSNEAAWKQNRRSVTKVTGAGS